MFLFQIGDWRPAVNPSSLAGLSLNLNRSWRAPSTVLANSSGAYQHADPRRPLLNAGTYSMSGSFISGMNGAEDVNEQFGYLLNLAGRPFVPIIAWVPDRSIGAVYSPDFPNDAFVRNDIWLLTYGIINNVQRTHAADASGGRSTLDVMQVSFDIECDPYWEPLSKIHWRYRSSGFVHSPYIDEVVAYPPDINDHPNSYSLSDIIVVKDMSDGFEKLRFDPTVYGDSPFLSPDNWVRAYARSADTAFTQFTACLPTEDPDDAVQLISGGEVQHECYPDPSRWAAAPRSMYYFSNFAITGAALAIKVEVLDFAGKYSVTASVDLADIDDILTAQGYDAAKPTDRIIVGGGIRPGGYYLRDNGSGVWEPLDIYVPWNYSGLYPGETFPGRNIVTIYGPSATTYSYAHIFRTL